MLPNSRSTPTPRLCTCVKVMCQSNKGMPSTTPAAGRVAFTYPSFVSYTFARFFIVLTLEMQSVAVAWQVYEITKSPLDLGYVGLAQFLPGFVLFLFAGHAADLFDRRKLLMWCYGGFGICSMLLLAISWRAPQSVHLIYAVLVLLGVSRSFSFPVSRAILPQ